MRSKRTQKPSSVKKARAAPVREASDKAAVLLGAEDAFTANADLFRKLFAYAAVGLAITDLDHQFLEVNQVFCSFTGYSEAELKQTSFLEIIQPADRSDARQRLRTLLTGKTSSYIVERKVIRKDGGIVWIQNSVSLIRGDDGRPTNFFTLSEDITERKRAEVGQREAERKYRDIFENAVEGIFQTTPEGGFITANPALARMLGFESPEELILARIDVGRTHYVDAERRVEFKRLLDQHDIVRDFAFEAYRKDGTKIWMSENVRAVRDASGKVLYYEGTVEDITERKRAEEALRESEERYRDLVENSRDLICTHDLDGLILSANPAAVAAVGYDPNEFVGKKTIRDLLAPEVEDQFEQYMERLRKEGTTSGIMLVQTRSGERRVWEYYNSLRTEGVATPIVRGMARDITERKQAEAALRQSEREYRGLFENAHDAILILSPEREIVLEVNQRACEIYGIGRSEFIGMSLEGISKNAEHGRLRIQETLERGVFHNFETIQRRGDGTEMILDINASVVQYKGQTAIQSINRDMTDRKRAEEDRFNLRRELELTMNSMEEGVHRVDTQGNIAFENPAAARMLGWEVTELLGKPAHLTMHHTRQDGTTYPRDECPIYATLRDGVSRHATDEVFWRQDGTSFPVEYKTAPMRNDRNEIVAAVVTFSDIAERRRAEESLQLFRNLIDRSNDAIEVIDPITLRFIDCNESAYRSLGYSREEFLALTVFDIDPMVDRSMMDRLDEKMKESGFATLESLHLRKDGTTFPVEVNVKIVRLERDYRLAVVRDITRRKQAEEALRDSEERYRELFENAKDAIYVHDLKGRYTSVNRAAEKLLGFAREEILGQHYSNFVAPRDLRYPRENFCKKLDDEAETIYEIDLVAKDRRRVHVEVSSRLILENGVPIGVQGTARDITERKRAEDVLRTYSRRLIDAQETERRRIARELHDQVGQMLTALKLNLHAIQGAGNAREVQPLIEDNLKLLDEALEQVRDLSVDLRPLLLDDLGLVTALRWYVDRQAQRTGVRAEFTCDSLDPDLRFSPKLETACFRIAQEALTNVARHAQAKLVTVRLSRNDSRLSLLIKDDGVGFDIDALQRHDVAAATLGLRGMDERAHAVGGRIKIDSATDRGTQVFVELPIAMSNGRSPELQNE